MSAAGRWFVLAAVLLVCVAAGFGAYTLAQISWNAVVDYESPYLGVKLQDTPTPDVRPVRTVLVIVDGLRLDASRDMGTMEALRRSGRDVELVVPQPSLSYPNWTTILSGAPPYVSGVVTNWHEGRAPVETLFDTADRQGVDAVFVGPSDFEQLYGVRAKTAATFMLEWDEGYLTDRYVDEALRLAETRRPGLIVVHLPDVDEAGHASGGGSERYARTVARVDADLGRLVNGLQDGSTVFVITADHGHIDSGGHGGWEPEAVTVPCVVTGPGVVLGRGEGRLEDVAPTVAALVGIPAPRQGLGMSLLAGSPNGAVLRAEAGERVGRTADLFEAELAVGAPVAGATPLERISSTQAARLDADRRERMPLALLGWSAALVVVLLIGVASIRALGAGVAGTLAYFGSYNAAFFLLHGYRWSLSAFNSEDRIEAWMNGRLVEAALAGLIAAAVAGLVYPLLRREPKGARGRYLAGWLTLGPTTVLVTLIVFGVQVAWFAWWWGVVPEWRLPDLMWGFKYDLDLIQATAIGFVAPVTSLVTWGIGRYHPMMRTRHEE